MRISVIIATTCEQRRERELWRAVRSVLRQGVDVELLVIVNGSRVHGPLREALLSDSRVRVRDQEAGSYPAALRLGRQEATGPYFACLDDDDYFLDGALAARLAAMTADGGIDVVVTNGYRDSGGQPALVVSDPAGIHADPLEAALRANWFPSSSGLFRSATIGAGYFDGTTRYFEWTWLLYKLLLSGRRVRFLDTPTFHISDTPGSLSKDVSVECLSTELWMLREVERQVRTPRQRALLRTKLSQGYHHLAEKQLRSGRRRDAWRAHLRSLTGPGGWRHLAFTRYVAGLQSIAAAPRTPD
jgi:hypothetical protein